MLKKVIAFSLSALFLGCGFGFAKAASNFAGSDEERAAKIQSLEMAKYSSQSAKCKINRLITKIKENDLELKYLKARRTKLDGKLATILQLKESSGWFGRIKFFGATRKISKKIDANEERMAKVEKKSEKLDGEFVELLRSIEI